MGNNNSKPRTKQDGLQSYPSFSRSDTQGSTRSTRSIRSRLSVNSDHGSFKSALEQVGSPPATSDYNYNNNSNSNIISSGANTPGSTLPQPPDSSSSYAYSSSPNHQRASSFNSNNVNGSAATPGVGAFSSDGYPFPILPKSMQQLEPKEPILMRRDKDGNFTAPNTPSTEAFSSSLNSLVGDSLLQPLTPAAAGTPNERSQADNNGSGEKNGPLTASTNSSNSNNGISNSTNNSNNDSDNDNTSTGGFSSSVLANLPFENSALSAPTTPRNIPKLQHPASPAAALNIEEIIQRLLDAGYSGKATRSVCLKNGEIALICQAAREIFLSQPTLLELSTPVKIVGDVHGQYGDLIRLFDMCGFPPAANYLFLGDYVDRGKQSLETILLLLCYKIKYPENFFLLRGNHECANVTRVYGFFDECKRRCNTKTWKIFIDTFNSLPIAAVVAQKIFCVHGGLSPALNNLNEIRNIERPTDVPDYGLLNDLLWSDPADTNNEWEDNERGVSYCFNKVAINKFLSKFSFDLVCRAHMVVEDGYEFFNDRSLVTVFSAPNYCGEFDNWGAVMSVSEGLLCSFELLKPLDSVALKQEMKKGKHERRNGLLSPSPSGPQSY